MRLSFSPTHQSISGRCWTRTILRDGSKAAVRRPADRFRSTPINGHFWAGRVGPFGATAQSRCAPARCAGGKSRGAGSRLRGVARSTRSTSNQHKLRKTQFEHMFSAFALELGLCSTPSACLKRAKSPLVSPAPSLRPASPTGYVEAAYFWRVPPLEFAS